MWSVACVAFLGEFSATICISWVSVCLDFEVMKICVSKLTAFCGTAAAFFFHHCRELYAQAYPQLRCTHGGLLSGFF